MADVFCVNGLILCACPAVCLCSGASHVKTLIRLLHGCVPRQQAVSPRGKVPSPELTSQAYQKEHSHQRTPPR